MTIQDVAQSINEVFATILDSATSFLPRIFWSLILVGGGWLAAWLFKKITLKLVKALDQLFQRVADQKALPAVQLNRYGHFIAGVVFWISFLFAIILAIQLLELEFLSTFLQNTLLNLPHLIVGILIVFASFLIGSVSRQFAMKAFYTMQVEHAEVLGNLIKGVIVFMGVLLGVGQVGVDVSILNAIVSISCAAILGAMALAFGIGAKPYVENVISSVQIRKIYQSGDTVMIDDVAGKIIEITSTMVFLQSNEGQISMPAKLFLQKTSILITPQEKDETR